MTPKAEASPTIVTGQQIGLLGGPLYSLSKVAGAIALAKVKNGKAIYWLETNDSDFREVSWFYSTASHNTYRWSKYTGGLSIGNVKIDSDLIAVLTKYLSEIQNKVPTSNWSEYKDVLMSAYSEGKTFSKASEELNRWIWQDYLQKELSLFNPQSADFISFSQKYLLNEISKTKKGEQVNGFLMESGVRKALFISESADLVDRAGKSYSDILDSLPTSDGLYLVPNVNIRSVIQDAYFSNSVYVAGPGEVKYLDEMKSQYDFHQVSPAIVFRRMHVSLINKEQKELLESIFDISQNAFTDRDELETLLNRAAQDPDDFFSELRSSYLGKINPYKVKKAALEAKNKIVFPSKSRERKTYRLLKHLAGGWRKKYREEHSSEIVKLDNLRASLFPHGKLQERTVSVFDMIMQFGRKNLIDRVVNENLKQLNTINLDSNQFKPSTDKTRHGFPSGGNIQAIIF